MVFYDEKESYTYYYDVDFDIKLFQEFLQELSKYTFVVHAKGEMPSLGALTPNRLLSARIAGSLSKDFDNKDLELITDSIVIKKKNSDVIEYEYSYIKKPNLYYIIQYFIGEADINQYYYLFNREIQSDPRLYTFYNSEYPDQLLINLLFNYY